MYLKEDVVQLEKKTRALLSVAKKAMDPSQVTDLRDVLRFHEYRYYIENDPLIADGEYDLLYKALEKLESDHPALVTPDSPTQRVATVITKEFFTAPHLVPMLSLENSYNEDDLRDWDRKARDMAGIPDIEYCVEPKFDGASISLVYENDHLLRGIDSSLLSELLRTCPA